MPTAISWTTETWNPVHGCSKISDGCLFCYAAVISRRFGHTQKPWTFLNARENVILKPHKLKEPHRHKEPKRIFVNSMSDVFHELVPLDYVKKIFHVMNELPRHTFQILTKRPERMLELSRHLEWTPNISMGVSVESEKLTNRIDLLREVPAHVRFVSFEPLISEIKEPDLTGIGWAIVGGESGLKHREMPHSWARRIRDACLEQDTAFFFKQSAHKWTERGVALEHEDGSRWIWQQFPEDRRDPVEVPHQIDGAEVGLYVFDHA